MKARVQWLDGRAFVGESGSGHAVVMDGAPEAGGRNVGVRPMEMLLLGLGGCTAFDVVMILEKAREKITGCEVELESERASEDPKVFTKVTLIFKITGKGLKRANVERAGGGPLVRPWPLETPLSLPDRIAAQQALIALGFDPGKPDGVVGINTRSALRAWQKSRGMVADGYLSMGMVGLLKAEVPMAGTLPLPPDPIG